MVLRTEDALAEPPKDAGSIADAASLVASREIVHRTTAVAGAPFPGGAVTLAIAAPIAVVKDVVGDYAHYQDVVPGLQRSRVLARSKAGTDVYLQAPILHGAATLWSVVRFGPPVREAGGERIDGRRAGPANIEDLRATFRLRSIDDAHTLLDFEFLLVPTLPLPGSIVTPELEASSEIAARALRDRAEMLVESDPAASVVH